MAPLPRLLAASLLRLVAATLLFTAAAHAEPEHEEPRPQHYQPQYRRGTHFIQPGNRSTVGEGGAVVGRDRDHPLPAPRGAMGTFGGWFGTPGVRGPAQEPTPR